jgi:nucleotide-binding universal stress UspA family protein
MVTYKNVLFCTDFSANAQAALPYAIDLAKKYGAALHLVHVYQEPEHVAELETSPSIKSDWVRVAHLLGTEKDKKLKEICENITKEMGSCLPKMLRGKPHTEILRYARESGVDLIVMGSHGLSGLEQVLFGSTADRVMRESSCDVLIIKKKG